MEVGKVNVIVRCERCGEEYSDAAVLEHGRSGFVHPLERCFAFVKEERDELRVYLTTEGPEHLRTENACLRSALFRAENEKKMATDALSRTQKRCTELLEEVRLLLKGGVCTGEPEGILQGRREKL